jgi:hypothetical protein
MIEPNEFPSAEEMYLWWYLKELYEAGYILDIVHQPEAFQLSDNVKLRYHGVIKKLKKGDVMGMKEFPFIRSHEYTADYRITWDETAQGIFIKWYDDIYKDTGYFWARLINDEVVSYVDSKGSFTGRNNTSAATFPLNQKWVYDKYEIFVQKIVHVESHKKGMAMKYTGLFPETFTPVRYLTCDVSNAKRKIGYPVVLLDEYLKKI